MLAFLLPLQGCFRVPHILITIHAQATGSAWKPAYPDHSDSDQTGLGSSSKHPLNSCVTLGRKPHSLSEDLRVLI